VESKDVGVNWAGNHRYAARTLHRPTSVEQVQELVAVAANVRVLGSRHSFNDIADADQLISLEALPDDVMVDPAAGTVSLAAGLRYGALAVHLVRAGLALHNLASLPHISVAGAVTTATHGSGVGNGNLATAVAGLELVTSTGELLRVSRGDPDFDGLVVGLGALGAVTRVTLDVQPAYEVRQRVFEGLGWEALAGHFDEIMTSGYSVSVFTRWQETVDQVWVKSRLDQPERTGSDLFGARPATAERHPILGIDPAPATPQLGRPGPWYDRLPHFRMGFTPSAGEELQSEYLLPRRHAVAAIEAVRGLADRIRPHLLVTEIRTVAADRLWMSTSYGWDSVALHFTWRQQPQAVAELLVVLERVLAPFGARPHWGKVFAAGAASIAPRYERHADFLALAGRLDARGAFRNRWLQRSVLGATGEPPTA
jgi:xylitol oxidase